MIPAGGKAVKKVIDKMFYSSDAAMYSAFIGLFLENIKGGEYIHNSPSILLDTWIGRKIFGVGSEMNAGKAPFAIRGLVFVLQAFYQHILYGNVVYSEPNKICSNTDLSTKLFQWSMQFVK